MWQLRKSHRENDCNNHRSKSQRKKRRLKGMAAFFMLVLGVTLLSGCASKQSDASKDTYPEKPITLVVPWAPGGTADTNARIFAPCFEKNIGQKVTVLNKEGSSGFLGTKYVADAKADGYTVLYSAETPGTFQVMGMGDLSYHDFEPIMMLLDDPKILVVAADSKYQTIEELVADIQANPGKIKMSYTGPGASGHIQGLLYQEAGLDISMTPFGGGSAPLTAVLGGQVDFTNANLGTVMDYIKSGDMRALAVFSNQTTEALPGVPAITAAVPALEKYLPLSFPQSILVKKGTPTDVKQKILDACQAAVKEPEWKRFMEENQLISLSKYTGNDAEQVLDHWTSLVSWLLYDSGAAKMSPEDFSIPKPE